MIVKMTQRCDTCIHYLAVSGQPPAGWCVFMANTNLPFWLERFLATQQAVRKGDDVLADDGAECAAWSA